MSEQAKTTDQPAPDAKDQKPEDAKQIVLDADTYAALLDRLDELEGGQKEETDEPKDEVDDLAAGAKPQPGQQKPIDLNRLSNAQLAQFIAQELTSDVINPVLVKLSQMELRLEEKDMASQYKDFGEHKKEAYNILHKTPSLSLEQAYHLAVQKANKGSKPKSDDSPNDEKATPESKGSAKKELLRHLPKRPTTLGEKPSGAAGDMKPARPKDVRGAAERAIDDLGIDFPSKGGNI